MPVNKSTRQTRIALLGLTMVGLMMAALGLGLFMSAGQASAQTSTTAAATTAADTTAAATTAAGTNPQSGSTIYVFCLDFGKTFPAGQTIKAQGLANDKLRGGLNYALTKGYVTSDPYQVQLAMWQLQDNQPFHDTLNKGTTIAQEIVNNAGNAPSGDASAVSNLTVTNITESSPQSAYGTGTVQGNANTNGLPVGFLLPASGSNFQNLLAVVSSNNAAATTAAATTAAATTPAATTAAATTAAATTAATTTAAPTTAAATTAASNSGPTAVAGESTYNAGGQGGAPNAPSTGFGGGQDDNSLLGLGLLLAGLLVVTGASFIGFRRSRRSNM
ncbi:MAG TPA: hypothetical protein VH186_01730 [Chloroflexia bacterium]|nr:hypothetical protein [Chloroflexia bacterium]